MTRFIVFKKTSGCYGKVGIGWEREQRGPLGGHSVIHGVDGELEWREC